MAKGEVFRSFEHALHDFYKPLADPSSRHVDVSGWGPSLTRQEFADDADINVLMSRFPNAGMLPPMGEPMYVDFANMPQDLLGTMEFLADAAKAFMTLPAVVRKEFDNNPNLFCDYAADPRNLDQMRAWGLAPPAPVPDAPKEPPAPQEPAPPSFGLAALASAPKG